MVFDDIQDVPDNITEKIMILYEKNKLKMLNIFLSCLLLDKLDFKN